MCTKHVARAVVKFTCVTVGRIAQLTQYVKKNKVRHMEKRL